MHVGSADMCSHVAAGQAETGSPTKMKSNTHPLVPDTFLLKLLTAVLFFRFFEHVLEHWKNAVGKKQDVAQTKQVLVAEVGK